MNKSLKKKLTAVLLVFTVSVTCFSGSYYPKAKTELSDEDFEHIIDTYNIGDNCMSYNSYMEVHRNAKKPDREINIGTDAVVRYEESGIEKKPVLYENYEGMSGKSILTGEDSLTEWEIVVPETGLYNLSLVYYPVAGKNSDIQRSIFIDGALPFKEYALVSFPRVWTSKPSGTHTDENGVTVREWSKDNQGNEEKPEMVEIPEWQTRYTYDSDGYVTEALSVYLTQGKHTVTLDSVREPMLINSLVLSNSARIDDYQTVKAKWDAKGAKDTSGQRILIEAENASKTSSQMLYPQQDQASPDVVPASSKELLNNTIGGNSWRLVGQWVEWQFDVPETGYYEIGVRVKQNFSRGVEVSRRISIDGEVPFSELQAYGFAYAQDWRTETLSDDDDTPYKFYLEKGTHTIRMEVVLGDFAEIVGQVQEALRLLNDVYRDVIKITGVAPDSYRDYLIEETLPGLTDDLVEAKTIIDDALSQLDIVAGSNSDKKTVLKTMSDQLEDLIKDNEYIVRVLATFKVNIRALGTWIMGVISQPLQFDSICVFSEDTGSGYKNAGFFKKFGHEMSRLFYSFIIDYNRIGNVNDDKDATVLTLWVGTGRDQANVIKRLIDESFTPNTGVSVNVQLVDMGTLIKASLVGEGPDVAVQVNLGLDGPVNYGVRSAVTDLTQFSDYKEVLKRFPEAAATPFMYHGALYALPETISYPVMFYRRDILSEIGLEVPETWDDVKVAMSVLAKSQMEFGMIPNEALFASLLFQNGGSYYNSRGTVSNLDSDIGVETFKKYCIFYTDYKLDRETSITERFRTGECPLIIADYQVYNEFAVSAPDIAGLWSFTQIPGTKKEDGTIDRTVAGAGIYAMMMDDTKYKNESWEFLKWWTSAETQTAYGREMESLMGAAARVPTANLEAFANTAWPVSIHKALEESMKCVKGIPQVPGGYYTWRNINNAFYSVVTNPDTSSPREELMDQVIYINAEIAYKMDELKIKIED